MDRTTTIYGTTVYHPCIKTCSGASCEETINLGGLFAMDQFERSSCLSMTCHLPRGLALAVHPDKCKDTSSWDVRHVVYISRSFPWQDAKAKEAFQALSEAFEQLSSAAW
jgi:hypothetical protein